jgi:hypothetical protein
MSLRWCFETQHIQSPPTAGWIVGTTPIIAGVAGHRWAVYAAIMSAASAAQVTFANDDATTISGLIALPAGGPPFVLEIPTNADPWFVTKENAGLSLVIAGSVVTGDLYLLSVPNQIRSV